MCDLNLTDDEVARQIAEMLFCRSLSKKYCVVKFTPWGVGIVKKKDLKLDPYMHDLQIIKRCENGCCARIAAEDVCFDILSRKCQPDIKKYNISTYY